MVAYLQDTVGRPTSRRCRRARSGARRRAWPAGRGSTRASSAPPGPAGRALVWNLDGRLVTSAPAAGARASTRSWGRSPDRPRPRACTSARRTPPGWGGARGPPSWPARSVGPLRSWRAAREQAQVGRAAACAATGSTDAKAPGFNLFYADLEADAKHAAGGLARAVTRIALKRAWEDAMTNRQIVLDRPAGRRAAVARAFRARERRAAHAGRGRGDGAAEDPLHLARRRQPRLDAERHLSRPR